MRETGVSGGRRERDIKGGEVPFWLKLWIEPNLNGPVRIEMTPAERGVYYDLQLLAKSCNQGGRIATETGKKYPLKWVAARLNIGDKLLQKTVRKGTLLGVLGEDPRGIYIVGFDSTQSDYYRQKPYRQRKEEDPGKYTKGPLGHMVAHSQADIDRIRGGEQ